MYELLRGIPGSYAWSNPLPEAECRRHGLVQHPCPGVALNRDVALWQAKYGLAPIARDCLVALQEAAGRQGMLLNVMQQGRAGTGLGAKENKNTAHNDADGVG